jgi:hypothetical protein
MADIVRSAKSGSDWTRNELLAYNISIVEQGQGLFFGGPLPAYTGPAGFVRYEDKVRGLDAPSLSLIKRLYLAMKIQQGEESFATEFSSQVLRALGYETENTIVYQRKSIRLVMCGQRVYAETDVCVLDTNSEILLLVQEDKTHISVSDPEPQLVAEAVAAFQTNNRIREDELFLQPLQRYIFPGITMVGTFPRFYKITVTADLDYCIQSGVYPPTQTIVYRHTPRVPTRQSEGMRPLINRQLVLRCYEAFKQFVFPEEGIHPSLFHALICD